LDCGHCFYSELIDGVLFCYYLCDDVDLKFLCKDFINNDRLKEILKCDDDELERILHNEVLP